MKIWPADNVENVVKPLQGTEYCMRRKITQAGRSKAVMIFKDIPPQSGVDYFPCECYEKDLII